MTRINCGIDPMKLSNKHLISEHREIKRIPNKIKKGKFRMSNQPKEFCLGRGHVKFFYDKLLYLKNRYEQIYSECLRRQFKVTYFGGTWDSLPEELMNDYLPTNRDREIVMERILERSVKN